MGRGTCRQTDATGNLVHSPDLFFPSKETGASCWQAKAICAHCPVKISCATYGLEEPSGIWGGLAEVERRIAIRMIRKGASVIDALKFFAARKPQRIHKGYDPAMHTVPERSLQEELAAGVM